MASAACLLSNQLTCYTCGMVCDQYGVRTFVAWETPQALHSSTAAGLLASSCSTSAGGARESAASPTPTMCTAPAMMIWTRLLQKAPSSLNCLNTGTFKPVESGVGTRSRHQNFPHKHGMLWRVPARKSRFAKFDEPWTPKDARIGSTGEFTGWRA